MKLIKIEKLATTHKDHGCVNPAWARVYIASRSVCAAGGIQEGALTQPRDHSFAHSCKYRQDAKKVDGGGESKTLEIITFLALHAICTNATHRLHYRNLRRLRQAGGEGRPAGTD